jgi:hypothetical protein
MVEAATRRLRCRCRNCNACRRTPGSCAAFASHFFVTCLATLDADATIELPPAGGLGETAREFANLAAGALILGQFLGGQRFSWWLMLADLVAWFGMTGFGLLLLKEE